MITFSDVSSSLLWFCFLFTMALLNIWLLDVCVTSLMSCFSNESLLESKQHKDCPFATWAHWRPIDGCQFKSDRVWFTVKTINDINITDNSLIHSFFSILDVCLWMLFSLSASFSMNLEADFYFPRIIFLSDLIFFFSFYLFAQLGFLIRIFFSVEFIFVLINIRYREARDYTSSFNNFDFLDLNGVNSDSKLTIW